MRSIIVFGAAVALVASSVSAGELAGVSMPDQVTVGDQALVLNGMALRSKAIFKVYVAGLYLPARQSDAPQVLAADGPRRLDMHFVRSVGSEKICDGWLEGLEANTPNAGVEVERQFESLCRFMEDAKTGDHFVFTYVPGEGTEVKVKDRVKGQLEGKAFADALFSCWIGPHPGPGEEFRDDLMGL